jgi:hypothetical protein
MRSSDRKTWIALSRRNWVRVFAHERNRTDLVAEWSVKDPDGRQVSVHNLAIVPIEKRLQLMVETQLFALRVSSLKEGARHATRISFVPWSEHATDVAGVRPAE